MKTQGALLAVPTIEGFIFINPKEIMHCESDGNYTVIHLQGGNHIVICKRLKLLEPYLTEQHFVRVHQSHLVNLQYLKKYLHKKGGQLLLVNNTVIPVSRSKKKALLELFNLI